MTESVVPPKRPLRERLRTGALVTYFLVCLVFTLPGGSRLVNRQVWDSPHNREQFQHWAGTLEHLGFDVTGASMKHWLWGFTQRYVHAHSTLLRPLRWLPEQLGFGQSWRMFSNPQTTPSRLWVEVDDGEGYAPIYVSRSHVHTWRQPFFEHHRVRKLLGRIGRGGRDAAYGALAAWIARRAFEEYPSAAQVRVRIYTWTTPSAAAEPRFSDQPEFGRRKGKFRHELVFTRENAL
jgi:hypothetical protein